jgi:hypothetical protein
MPSSSRDLAAFGCSPVFLWLFGEKAGAEARFFTKQPEKIVLTQAAE